MQGKIGVVITTINSPSDRILDWLRLENATLIVVGDKSTPSMKWHQFCENLEPGKITFVDCEAQQEEFPFLSDSLGWKTYARKNIGYLVAKRMGCTDILETDDDTFPRSLLFSTRLASLKPTHSIFAKDGDIFWNPYDYFAPQTNLWARGTPLNRIKQPALKAGVVVSASDTFSNLGTEPHIIQFLVDNEPDLDAIFRLSQRDIVHNFDQSTDLIEVPRGILAPSNTQGTVWRNIASVQELYFPSTVSLRIADILKMYIAQVRLPLLYGGFNVTQDRNPHDFFQDFVLEMQMYLDAEKWIKFLSNQFDAHSSIREIYQLLISMDLIPERELLLLDAFIAADQAL